MKRRKASKRTDRLTLDVDDYVLGILKAMALGECDAMVDECGRQNWGYVRYLSGKVGEMADIIITYEKRTSKPTNRRSPRR